jgi:hypothetical protein
MDAVIVEPATVAQFPDPVLGVPNAVT